MVELIDYLPITEWSGLAYLPKLVAPVVNMWRRQGLLGATAMPVENIRGRPLIFIAITQVAIITMQHY